MRLSEGVTQKATHTRIMDCRAKPVGERDRKIRLFTTLNGDGHINQRERYVVWMLGCQEKPLAST
jgi:hypothetical protein